MTFRTKVVTRAITAEDTKWISVIEFKTEIKINTMNIDKQENEIFFNILDPYHIIENIAEIIIEIKIE